MAGKRIVIKIGSSSLTNEKGGLSKEKLREHAKALILLKKQGFEVVLISSGAVSAGFNQLGFPYRPVSVTGKQAAASVGQGLLIHAYSEIFNSQQIVASQLLLTRDVFTNKEKYSNVYNTLSELLKRSAIPIINENDSVAVDELTFGDNDMLSALVSGLIKADYLIMLTDINGIYDKNPFTNPTARRYDTLTEIPDSMIENFAVESHSKLGTGGMKSKLQAAKTALSLGVPVFIGTGSGHGKLLEILDRKGDGTYIGHSGIEFIKKTKQWIAIHSNVAGRIKVDDGAAEALVFYGKSLLPAGIKEIEGEFRAGDVVEVLDIDSRVLGKGEVNYSSKELKIVKGMGSKEAMPRTRQTRPEVIHRDRLVLWTKEAGR